MRARTFFALRADRRPAFSWHALVQDLPDQSTQPVSDGTDRLRMSEAGHKTLDADLVLGGHPKPAIDGHLKTGH